MTVSKLTPYTDQYKESCFQAWYAADRPTRANELEEILPEDKYGRKPVIDVFRRWRNDGLWDVKADALDAKAFGIVEDSLINSKVLMLKEQAARARKLQYQAEDYLDTNGFDSSSSAVQGLIRGAELEQRTRGLSAKLLELADLDNDALTSRTQKLLQRYIDSGEGGEILEAEEVIIDAESED